MKKIVLFFSTLMFSCLPLISLAQEDEQRPPKQEERPVQQSKLSDKMLYMIGANYQFYPITSGNIPVFSNIPSFYGISIGAHYVLWHSNDVFSLNASGLTTIDLSLTSAGLAFCNNTPIMGMIRVGTGATRFNESKVGIGIGAGMALNYLTFPYTDQSGQIKKINQFFAAPAAAAEINFNLNRPVCIRFHMNLMTANGNLDQTSLNPIKVKFNNFGFSILYNF